MAVALKRLDMEGSFAGIPRGRQRFSCAPVRSLMPRLGRAARTPEGPGRHPGSVQAWRTRAPPGCSRARPVIWRGDYRGNAVPATDEVQVTMATDRDEQARARVEQHWKASESGDSDTEHAIYATDAILDYPQSGERFRGRSKIQAQRGGAPAQRHFTVLRIRGGGDLWISECVITYDGAPTYSVSIIELG